jgi:ribulose-5-phosphate 4-epimerase/fuculose-1-phosphate aldolase
VSEAVVSLSSVRQRVSKQEWQVREDLAAAYRLVDHYRWSDMVFTHLSARVPGPEDHFLLNPFGYLFNEVTASNLVKIDVEGNVVLDCGHGVNSAGFTIHSAVHMSREDANAVMHLHTDAGVAVSSTRAGFLPLNQHAMFVYPGRVSHPEPGWLAGQMFVRSWMTHLAYKHPVCHTNFRGEGNPEAITAQW